MNPSDQHWKRFAICWCVVAIASVPFASVRADWSSAGLAPWAIPLSVVEMLFFEFGEHHNSVLAGCAAALTTLTLGACARSKPALTLAMGWFALNITLGYFFGYVYSHE